MKTNVSGQSIQTINKDQGPVIYDVQADSHLDLAITSPGSVTINLQQGAHTSVAALANESLELNVNHLGQNSDSDIIVIAKAQVNDEDHVRVNVTHADSNQTSNQLIRGLAEDYAVLDSKASITIEKDIEKIEAHLDNKNLLLSDSAKIFTEPVLKIDSDDVKCSHGATIGQIDENQLFYMQSRGIQKAEAIAMLQDAFFQEAIEAIQNKEIKRIIEEAYV